MRQVVRILPRQPGPLKPSLHPSSPLPFTSPSLPVRFPRSGGGAGERREGDVKEMQRLDWSLSRKVTQDIKTQPQINHYQSNLTS